MENGLVMANQTLAPTIQIMNEAAASVGIKDFDFWQFMNWLFVVHYWALLLDFGQVAPTIPFTLNSTGPGYIYEPVPYSSGNNIFVNATLFQIYSDYLHDTILRIFPVVNTAFMPVPSEFMPVTSENQINASVVSLNILYTCTDVARKSAINFIISVLVADWAFVSAFLTIATLAGKWLETRKTQDGKIRRTFL